MYIPFAPQVKQQNLKKETLYGRTTHTAMKRNYLQKKTIF